MLTILNCLNFYYRKIKRRKDSSFALP